MKYSQGDRIRIRSKEWMNELKQKQKDIFVFYDGIAGPSSHCEESNIMTGDMQKYAGKMAKIKYAGLVAYSLDIDDGNFAWQDWMFDPDFLDDLPLEDEDAVRAMLDGETLYDSSGNSHSFTTDEIDTYKRLYRRPPGRKRLMTRWEVLDWVNSEASRGWVVGIVDDGDSGPLLTWGTPQWYGYDLSVEKYQRARLRPDLSGVDEDTIQGFEAEK